MKEIVLDSKSIVKDIKYQISRKKEKQDCVFLFLDNKEKITVPIDRYFEFGLKDINCLNQEIYDSLKREERLYLGYISCLRKLSIKDYSIKQVSDYLKNNKKLYIDEINAIINKLINYGLLDDDKYCQSRVPYLNKQLLSNKQIKLKLIKEGINSELIDKYVINNSEEEYRKAYLLANKYSSLSKKKSINAFKQNILSKLVNAGYSYDDSKSAIENLDIKNDNELTLLKKEYLKAKNKYEKKYEDYDLKKHIYSYLLNKGFKSCDINKVMEEQNGKAS